jgi:hypothetical protein
MNPPTGSGTQTVRHLRVVTRLLGCDGLEIANLFSIATHHVTAINEAGRSGAGWDAARPRLRQVITESDCLLAGWGVRSPVGPAAAHWRRQLAYVRACAREVGLGDIWTLNGEPRHPSRWHQYVSDRHGRATGTSLEERIAMVLTFVPVAMLCPDGGAQAKVVASPVGQP